MEYTNPVLKGFHPDPSICRVGEFFYLCTSTFAYFPGIPVYKSRDLLHWEHICDAISREEQLDYTGVAENDGVWAPTIRFHGGKFYITATFSGKGNFVISSDNIEKGFSNPVWMEMDGIDPSIYFEEGNAYYCANDCGSRMSVTGVEGISVARVDLKTGALLEKPVKIWEGTNGGFLESPHIYKVGNKYYLMIAEGGTNLNHMITIARADDIYGPYQGYQGNPILTNRNDPSKEVLCTGHGDMVEDSLGNWWMVHLGTRPSNGTMSHLGRETFLMPVHWSDGWPVVGMDKKSHLSVSIQNITDYVEYTSKEKEEWLFLKEQPGMKLKRLKDFDDSLFLKINSSEMEEGLFKGLVVYLTKDFYYRFGVVKKGGTRSLIFERKHDDIHIFSHYDMAESDDIQLGVIASKEKFDFVVENAGNYNVVTSASTRFMCCEVTGRCFTGTLWGIMNMILLQKK